MSRLPNAYQLKHLKIIHCLKLLFTHFGCGDFENDVFWNIERLQDSQITIKKTLDVRRCIITLSIQIYCKIL